MQQWSSVHMLLANVFAMASSLFMNVYITGLNQVTDVTIDEINKPYLPLAYGKLKMHEAVFICILSLFASLFIGFCHPRYSTLPLQVRCP
jgi:4-hydroxybenzoate polyprenyltransferase